MENTILYMPTDEEKKKLKEVCTNIIDCMVDLKFEQKVLVLKILTDSFTDCHKIKGVRIGGKR